MLTSITVDFEKFKTSSFFVKYFCGHFQITIRDKNLKQLFDCSLNPLQENYGNSWQDNFTFQKNSSVNKQLSRVVTDPRQSLKYVRNILNNVKYRQVMVSMC